ncbi:hypothetical protein MRX96_043927 [Rhipicephalus microplus]
MLCPGSSTAGPSHQGLPGRSRGGPRRPGCYRHRPAVRYKIRPGLNPGYRDISPQVSIRYYSACEQKGLFGLCNLGWAFYDQYPLEAVK